MRAQEIDRVSVVIPTHNRVVGLVAAVESVRQQSVPVSEIIVVDDGSSDSTKAVLASMSEKDQRIRVIHNKESVAEPKAQA